MATTDTLSSNGDRSHADGETTGPGPSQQPQQWQLHYYCDVGTTKVSWGVSVVDKHDPSRCSSIVPLRLQSLSMQQPQVCGYVKDENGVWHFRYGRNMQNTISSGEHTNQELVVVERLKMILLDEHHSADLRAGIESRLAHEPDLPSRIEEVFVKLLQALRVDAVKRTEELFPSLKSQIADMEIYTFFSTTDHVSPGVLRKYACLIEAAGFHGATFISESESSGAWHALKLSREAKTGVQNIPDLSENNELLALDGGGWTVHGMVYTLSGLLSNGAEVPMRATDRKFTIEAGSDLITLDCIRKCRDLLSQKYGTVENGLEALGHSSTAFDYTIRVHFEGFKADFDEHKTRWLVVEPTGFGSPDACAFTVKVTAAEVREWIDNRFDKIVASINRIRSTSTKVMTLAGGLFRSRYLVGRIRDYFSDDGPYISNLGDPEPMLWSCDLSVLFGMAARSKTEPAKVPFPYGFSMAQSETWNEKDHPDIPADSPERIVAPGDSKRNSYVNDRWKELLAPGVLVSSQDDLVVQYQWQEYNVYPEDKRLTKRIYWSVQRVEDHKPIFQNGQIREGVAPWGDVLVKEISDADFEKYPYAGRDGSNRMSKGLPRRVYARLTLRLDGLNMRLDWDRAPPNFKPYDNEDRVFTEPKPWEIIPIGDDSIHNANFTPFVKRLERASSEPDERSSTRQEPAVDRLYDLVGGSPDRSTSLSAPQAGSSRSKEDRYHESLPTREDDAGAPSLARPGYADSGKGKGRIGKRSRKVEDRPSKCRRLQQPTPSSD